MIHTQHLMALPLQVIIKFNSQKSRLASPEFRMRSSPLDLDFQCKKFNSFKSWDRWTQSPMLYLIYLKTFWTRHRAVIPVSWETLIRADLQFKVSLGNSVKLCFKMKNKRANCGSIPSSCLVFTRSWVQSQDYKQQTPKSNKFREKAWDTKRGFPRCYPTDRSQEVASKCQSRQWWSPEEGL